MFPLTAPMRGRIETTQDLVRGDIAVFIAEDGRLVFHRVIEVMDVGYRTKGDTLPEADAILPLEAVVGRIDAIGWGLLHIAVPSRGAMASLSRSLGLAWNRRAPLLRRWFRWAKQSMAPWVPTPRQGTGCGPTTNRQ